MDIYHINSVMHGDCVALMSRMESESIDFILTDPPYITRCRSRDGRTVTNDDNGRWLHPAFTQMYRLLKNGSFCVSFYGWSKADLLRKVDGFARGRMVPSSSGYSQTALVQANL